MTRWLSPLLVLLAICALCQSQIQNRELERALLKDYNRRHRPVKKESTAVNVNVYLSIGHIEEIDEKEQTMLVHGTIWMSWIDEYLKFDRDKYNTSRITLDPWRIWQPALALYNSAKASSWHLYMYGAPVSVLSNGKVWASGSFSFHVTCLFDFSNWPYDEQECPIVLADWVYDLSRVNLSDPKNMENGWNKPSVRLNFDPKEKTSKRHISGWEVIDTWRRHCYWGPNGCKSEDPAGNPEWYWSLLEFGIKIRRHAPYFMLTVVLPTFFSCLFTLGTYWIDNLNMAVLVTVFNIFLQALFGWDLIRELPPGSGDVPRIVTMYGINLSLTTFTFVFHVLLQYFAAIVPGTWRIPLGPLITSTFDRLAAIRFFKAEGLSFDPQLLFSNPEEMDGYGYDQPTIPKNSSQISVSQTPLTEDTEAQHSVQDTGEQLIELEVENGSAVIDVDVTTDAAENLPLSENADKPTGEQSPRPTRSAFMDQLFLIRRLIFIALAVVYFVCFPLLCFNIW